MKKLVFIPIFVVLFLEGFSQEKNLKPTDSTMPKENIQVNKQYDENGNLTRYDSIYSYSYSSSNKMNDSLQAVFQKYFKDKNVFPDGFFEDFFKQDSVTGKFNYDTLFSNGFGQQQGEIQQIMKQMDALQKLFYEDHAKPMSTPPAKPSK